MAIAVKDIHGTEHNVATRGVAIAGLTTGIIGSALGVLNSGMLGGAGLGGLGGNMANPSAANLLVEGANCCFVNKDQYYQERIADIQLNNAVVAGLTQQICGLRERVAVNETANTYQNRIVDIGFANVDTRFGTERQVTDFEIAAATCDFLKAQKVLTPNMLAEPFVKTDRAIDSHRVPFIPRPFDGGYNNGCGCGCGFPSN